jgi:Tfp pilus assembly protein PilV
MSIKSLKINESGDTIVEVLIAILILSLILSGAYVTSNNSLKNIRDAQERVQATSIAQGQAEELRAEASTLFANGNNNSYLSGPTTFCFYNDTLTPTSSGKCTINNLYDVAITGQGPSPAPSNTNKFKITINWNSISANQASDNLVIYYRVGI